MSNSIIDQQQELRYDGVVLDREWVKERIREQFAYIVEIYKSARTVERKKELFDSALGVVTNFAMSFPDIKMATYVYLMTTWALFEIQKPRPLPSFELGGIPMLGEENIFIHDVKLNLPDNEKLNSFPIKIFMDHS